MASPHRHYRVEKRVLDISNPALETFTVCVGGVSGSHVGGRSREYETGILK